MAVTEQEVKAALTEMKTAFEEFKKVNDAKIAAVKAERGVSDFDEKLSNINDLIAKQEKVQREWQRQQEAAEAKRVAQDAEYKAQRLEDERKIEARVNRLALGLNASADEVKGSELMERKVYGRYLRKGDQVMTADERKVLTEANDATGGYLAPPTYARSIIEAIVLISPMRGLANVVQIGTGELLQPKLTQTAAAAWIAEVATRSETQNPNWGLMKIPVHELMAETRISQQNLEDSAFDLEAVISGQFAKQFAVSEGAAVVGGNGVGKPLGFLDANAAGPATPLDFTKSGSAATIAGPSGSEGDGLIGLYHAVKSGYAANGRWLLNRGSLGKVRALKDTNGRYLWDPGIGLKDTPATILGSPYTETPDMPDEGANAFPIAFGDWKQAYTIVDRIEMSIVRDPFTVANVGQVKFFARRRVGGQVVLGEAARLLKCAV